MFAHLSPVFVWTKLSTRWRSSVRTWRSKTCPKLLPIKHPPPAFPFSCFSRVDYSLCIRHTLPLFLCNIPPDRRRASAPRATIYFTNRVANSTTEGGFHMRERERDALPNLWGALPSAFTRADRKSQVRQYLNFCTTDFWSSVAYASAEHKPKHCLTRDFLSDLAFTNRYLPKSKPCPC